MSRKLKILSGVAVIAAAALTLRAVARAGECAPETCGFDVGSTLRNLQALQEIHRAEHARFATALDELRLEVSPDVSIDLLHAQPDGWAARGRHRELEGASCVLWEGAVPVPPATDRGLVAKEPSRLYCDFPT